MIPIKTHLERFVKCQSFTSEQDTAFCIATLWEMHVLLLSDRIVSFLSKIPTKSKLWKHFVHLSAYLHREHPELTKPSELDKIIRGVFFWYKNKIFDGIKNLYPHPKMLKPENCLRFYSLYQRNAKSIVSEPYNGIDRPAHGYMEEQLAVLCGFDHRQIVERIYHEKIKDRNKWELSPVDVFDIVFFTDCIEYHKTHHALYKTLYAKYKHEEKFSILRSYLQLKDRERQIQIINASAYLKDVEENGFKVDSVSMRKLMWYMFFNPVAIHLREIYKKDDKYLFMGAMCFNWIDVLKARLVIRGGI